MVTFGAENELEWKYIMASSQHQNGAAESLIILTKRVMESFLRSYGESKLTLNEFNPLFWETANVVNERPIEINTQTRRLIPSIYLRIRYLLEEI